MSAHSVSEAKLEHPWQLNSLLISLSWSQNNEQFVKAIPQVKSAAQERKSGIERWLRAEKAERISGVPGKWVGTRILTVATVRVPADYIVLPFPGLVTAPSSLSSRSDMHKIQPATGRTQGTQEPTNNLFSRELVPKGQVLLCEEIKAQQIPHWRIWIMSQRRGC